MPPTSSQGTGRSAAHQDSKGSVVGVFDSRRDRTSSTFSRFKNWCEQTGFSVDVTATGEARRTGRHVAHIRAVAGSSSALGMSAVEDPSLMRCSADAMTLRLGLAGEGVHYIPAHGATATPAGRLFVAKATEHEVEVRQRSWRIALQLPATALRLTPDEIARVVAQEVHWQEWQASFLAGFSKALLCSTAAAPGVARRDLDLLLAGVAEFIVRSGLGEDRESSASALRRARARDYISLHMGDPGLRPGAVASHQGVTVRHLSRCFAEESTTVSAEIKRIRLERARDHLLARQDDHRVSLTEVARRHGFSSLSHFSRSFAEAFGLPPSELTC